MAVQNPDDPQIVATCDDIVIPEMLGVDECFNPLRLYGPGTNLLISLTPFPAAANNGSNDVTAALISTKQAAAAPDTLTKPIVCQLSLSPASDQTDRINGIDYPKPTDLSLAITIQDLSQVNYDFMRQTQQGGLLAHFWFLDRNGFFYGGRNGIFSGKALLTLRLNIPTDESALQTLTGTIKARGFFDPARQVSPIPYI